MKKIIAAILIVVGIGCFFAFDEKELSADDYIKYVEHDDSPTMNNKELGGLNFQLLYCPAEYLLLKEYKTDLLPASLIEQKKTDNDSMMFFKLRISAKDKSDVMNYNIGSNEEYYERVQFLSYGLEENIALLNGTDTIFPAIFHFERTYGVAPFADFMIAFNAKVKENDSFQVLIDDKTFDSGILKFSYDNKDIQNIPTLKTQ